MIFSSLLQSLQKSGPLAEIKRYTERYYDEKPINRKGLRIQKKNVQVFVKKTCLLCIQRPAVAERIYEQNELHHYCALLEAIELFGADPAESIKCGAQ